MKKRDKWVVALVALLVAGAIAAAIYTIGLRIYFEVRARYIHDHDESGGRVYGCMYGTDPWDRIEEIIEEKRKDYPELEVDEIRVSESTGNYQVIYTTRDGQDYFLVWNPEFPMAGN